MAEALQNTLLHGHSSVILSSPVTRSLALSFSGPLSTSWRLRWSCIISQETVKLWTKCWSGPPRLQAQVQDEAAVAADDGLKWWEKDLGVPVRDIHSAEELTEAIAAAEGKLVIVEFYASWCGSCRALFPKLCKLAAEHPDMVFVKINFDANKALCKSLNVKFLPYFHFYRGSSELLESFSCSITKLQKLKDAIAKYEGVGQDQLADVESSSSLTMDASGAQ